MNKWVVIKLVIFLMAALNAFFITPANVSDEIPVFIYIIIVSLSFFGSMVYFKAVSNHNCLTTGNMASSLKGVFHDPLPFFHLAAMTAFISGCFGVLRDTISGDAIDPIGLISFSVAIGLYPSIMVANRRFIGKQTVIQKK